MFYLIEIIVGFLVINIVNYLWKRHKLLQISNQFPGPKSLPFIGILAQLPHDPKEIFQIMSNYHKVYGKNVASWGLGLDWRIAVTDVNDLETILSSNKLTKKGFEYQYVKPWLGDGLLISFGNKWFQRRKTITPTFHFSILQQFFEVFERQENILVDKLKKHLNSGEFDIHPYVTLCALDIINETAMGVRVNAQNDPNSEYVQAVHDASELIYQRVFSLLGFTSFTWNLTSRGQKEKKALKILHNFTDKVIKAKQTELLQTHTESNINDNDNNLLGRKQKITFLELLLKSTCDGAPLSNGDIREEVDTFMFEGHDTTTAGIGFTLYHLSRHQEIQDKVYQEIESVYGKDLSMEMTYTSLQELKFMEMVIKESMRITPPVPCIVRYLTEDTLIGGVNVPANTNVSLPIFAIHRNEEYFPDPEKFDPERFSPENTEKRHPFAYIPFSAGSRNCIGQKFAMLEMKSAIMKVISNYKLLPGTTKMDVRADLVLRPSDGVFVKIVPR